MPNGWASLLTVAITALYVRVPTASSTRDGEIAKEALA